VRQIKTIATRLGVRDSDVVRFALKCTLGRIAPICDPQLRGKSLLPLFVEAGDDIIRYFELDAARLESLINTGATDELRVDREDIGLLTMSVAHPAYLTLRLSESNSGQHVADGLRQYLYEKYVYRNRNVEADTDPDTDTDDQRLAVG
jgi:hypothetical protein